MKPDPTIAARDREIIRRVLAGDTEAFGLLADHYLRPVLRLGSRFVSRRADLEDIGQETFVRAFRGLPGYDVRQPFSSWLYAVALNVVRDHLRRGRREAGTVSMEAMAYELPDGGAEREIRALAARRDLERAMEHLSPTDRMIVVLLELEGKSSGEVAELLRLSSVNVRVRAHRARRRLREVLEGRHETA